MAIITCSDCEHRFSNNRHKACPKCHPKSKSKKQEYKEGQIVITGDGPVKDQLIGGALFGIIVSFLFVGCQIITKETPEQKATHTCWYEATLAARAAGNKNFSHARRVSPTNAKLVFKKAGNEWETNYFCE